MPNPMLEPHLAAFPNDRWLVPIAMTLAVLPPLSCTAHFHNCGSITAAVRHAVKTPFLRAVV